MSNFKAKNLTYDKSQPAFLQRLRAEFGSGASGERNNVQFERGKKPSRLQFGDGDGGGDGDDDGPIIVDERGEGVSKEEYERMVRGDGGDDDGEKKDDSAAAAAAAAAASIGGPTRRGNSVVAAAAEIGNAKKKRKVMGKVVGSKEEVEEGEREGGDGEKGEEGTKRAGKLRQEREGGGDSKTPSTSTNTGKASRKKAKKVKLSFDDD